MVAIEANSEATEQKELSNFSSGDGGGAPAVEKWLPCAKTERERMRENFDQVKSIVRQNEKCSDA